MAKIVQTAGRNALGTFAPEFAQYFIGQSYLAPVSTSQVGVFNVTFEPGCRKLNPMCLLYIACTQ